MLRSPSRQRVDCSKLRLRRTPTGEGGERAFHYVVDGDVPAGTRVWVTTRNGVTIAEERNRTRAQAASAMETFCSADPMLVLRSEPITDDCEPGCDMWVAAQIQSDAPLVIDACGPREIRLAGAMDVLTERTLQSALESMRSSWDGRVVLDVGGVHTIDSAGLDCLRRAEVHGEVVLRNPGRGLLAALDEIGGGGHFPVL